MQLLVLKTEGLYCEAGDFYIDPWKPVARAVISHAHSDHARYGMQAYLCHTDSEPLLKHRLGHHIAVEGLPYGVKKEINGVELELHPAGHVIGSAQISVTYKGETWVYGGDYKTDKDGITPTFEPVRCHTFITESTFGLPVFKWDDTNKLQQKLQQWCMENFQQGKSSVVVAYALGKAQRVMHALSDTGIPMVAHSSVLQLTEIIKSKGYILPDAVLPGAHPKGMPCIYVVPPGASDEHLLKRFEPYKLCVVSGWMHIRGNKNRRNADLGLSMSDHADYYQLMEAIQQTGAERILVTHGFTETFSKVLQAKGLDALPLATPFGDENTNETL